MERARQLIIEQAELWEQLGLQVVPKVGFEIRNRQGQELGYVIEDNNDYIPVANIEDTYHKFKVLDPSITLVGAIRLIQDEKQRQYGVQ